MSETPLVSDQINFSDDFVGDVMPNPYSPPDVNQQSPPTAAKGGANQRKRNWASGMKSLAAGAVDTMNIDSAMGEWVTIFFTPQPQTADIFFDEDNLTRAFLSLGYVRCVAWRRNGNLLQIRNTTGGAFQYLISITDFESRPYTST